MKETLALAFNKLMSLSTYSPQIEINTCRKTGAFSTNQPTSEQAYFLPFTYNYILASKQLEAPCSFFVLFVSCEYT